MVVVRVGHKAPVVRVQGTIISPDWSADSAETFMHGKTARCALYLTVKVAGVVARPSTHGLCSFGFAENQLGTHFRSHLRPPVYMGCTAILGNKVERTI